MSAVSLVCRPHESLVDHDRPDRIDHDAGLALGKKPVTEGADQPAPLFPNARRHLELDLRQIDNDAIGICQQEGAEVDRIRQVGDKARALKVAADARIPCNCRVILGKAHFRCGRDSSRQRQT